MTENELSGVIIGTAISLHKDLGPGLPESSYQAALAIDPKEKGLSVQQQFPLPFVYK